MFPIRPADLQFFNEKWLPRLFFLEENPRLTVSQ
jgi:hypothetical protein